MYRVDTTVLSIPDAKRDRMRPVVVICVVEAVARVFVCTRTTQKGEGGGVFHAENEELGLNADGWFRSRWYQSVDLLMFRPPLVERLGFLDEATFGQVLEEVSG